MKYEDGAPMRLEGGCGRTCGQPMGVVRKTKTDAGMRYGLFCAECGRRVEWLTKPRKKAKPALIGVAKKVEVPEESDATPTE